MRLRERVGSGDKNGTGKQGSQGNHSDENVFSRAGGARRGVNAANRARDQASGFDLGVEALSNQRFDGGLLLEQGQLL